ncbi:o-succinylbenzoate synthase [Priestia taiwanensis]|uniref:o-succinylbenzoate synthase n=1 Tax=Priestia taiwanensis TaxID=1347902 RepID=A0A917AXH2_9BACI|nr:o-succinylbenzoate synthase [Priestia taiwanensis]MBM7363328.1 O-succinylbenzoate synthase [Priestia taiwanensis]GGE78071.1 o-succinylbenzoate synthase [Priestia taiwanensis]
MKITLHTIEMPLKVPFQTSYGTYYKRESIIVEIEDKDGAIGWGECVAFSEPWYTEETIKTSYHMLKDFFIPHILQHHITAPSELNRILASYKRNNMAKASLENALWDLNAKRQNNSLAALFGGVRKEIQVGVVVGLGETKEMLDQIHAYVEEGYNRVKVKISPDRDYTLLKEIRNEFPILPLMVDANSAYTIHDIDQLKRLDEFNLLMIEQPFGDNDFLDHRVLQEVMETPICLDESIHSLEDVKVAVALNSCQIINIKSGRVGGFQESIRIHDYCKEHNIPVWCGGMIETGIGRAGNIALSSLPNFVIPGDVSASARHWEEDIIYPEITLRNGKIDVPTSSGIGFEVNRNQLEKVTVYKEIIK